MKKSIAERFAELGYADFEIDLNIVEATKTLSNLNKYPSKSDTTFYNVYLNGEVLGRNLNTVDKIKIVDLNHKAIVEKVEDKKVYFDAVKKYHTQQSKIDELFSDALAERFGLTDNQKKNLLFSKAYEFGHSDGYDSIASYYQDMIDLIS